MLLSSSETRETLQASILVYKHRPERTGFNMCTENTPQQLTFLALLPWFLSYQLRYSEAQKTLEQKNDFKTQAMTFTSAMNMMYEYRLI